MDRLSGLEPETRRNFVRVQNLFVWLVRNSSLSYDVSNVSAT